MPLARLPALLSGVALIEMLSLASRGTGLRTAGPVDMMVPTGRDRLSVVADYRGPLAAPVAAGAEVGTLKILIGGQVAATAPLVTTEAVGKGDFRSRAAAGLRELLWGWW